MKIVKPGPKLDLWSLKLVIPVGLANGKKVVSEYAAQHLLRAPENQRNDQPKF
jgi:hypothetical protein